jgi:hypothetical protein
VPAGDRAGCVVALERCLAAWLAYRDAVADAVGLRRA